MWGKGEGPRLLPSGLGEWQCGCTPGGVALGFRWATKRTPLCLLSLDQEFKFYLLIFYNHWWIVYGDENDENKTKHKEIKVWHNQRMRQMSAVNRTLCSSWGDQWEGNNMYLALDFARSRSETFESSREFLEQNNSRHKFTLLVLKGAWEP